MPRRLQQQILKIIAEVCSRRDGLHLCMIDGAVGVERERDEGVSALRKLVTRGR